MEMALEELELVACCNTVLAAVGIASRTKTEQDVLQTAGKTSFLAHAVEFLLGKQLGDVSSATSNEQAGHIQTAIDALSKHLRLNLSHISGKRIANGSRVDVVYMLELLAALSGPVLRRQQPAAKPRHPAVALPLSPPCADRSVHFSSPGTSHPDTLLHSTQSFGVHPHQPHQDSPTDSRPVLPPPPAHQSGAQSWAQPLPTRHHHARRRPSEGLYTPQPFSHSTAAAGRAEAAAEQQGGAPPIAADILPTQSSASMDQLRYLEDIGKVPRGTAQAEAQLPDITPQLMAHTGTWQPGSPDVSGAAAVLGQPGEEGSVWAAGWHLSSQYSPGAEALSQGATESIQVDTSLSPDSGKGGPGSSAHTSPGRTAAAKRLLGLQTGQPDAGPWQGGQQAGVQGKGVQLHTVQGQWQAVEAVAAGLLRTGAVLEGKGQGVAEAMQAAVQALAAAEQAAATRWHQPSARGLHGSSTQHLANVTAVAHYHPQHSAVAAVASAPGYPSPSSSPPQPSLPGSPQRLPAHPHLHPAGPLGWLPGLVPSAAQQGPGPGHAPLLQALQDAAGAAWGAAQHTATAGQQEPRPSQTPPEPSPEPQPAGRLAQPRPEERKLGKAMPGQQQPGQAGQRRPRTRVGDALAAYLPTLRLRAGGLRGPGLRVTPARPGSLLSAAGPLGPRRPAHCWLRPHMVTSQAAEAGSRGGMKLLETLARQNRKARKGSSSGWWWGGSAMPKPMSRAEQQRPADPPPWPEDAGAGYYSQDEGEEGEGVGEEQEGEAAGQLPSTTLAPVQEEPHWPSHVAHTAPHPHPPPPPLAAGLALNRHLAGQLAAVHSLADAQEQQDGVQARLAAVQLAEEQQRLAARTQLLLRQAAAQARRDAASSVAQARLEQRAQTYMERMEAARMLRVLTEEEAAGRSRAMRAGAAQERALREAFMEAIEAEKERLLALRKERTTVPVTSMGSYLQELRRAEEHYLGLLGLMEDLAAAERRQRLAAEQDAMTARRALASEAAALHRQRVVDVLDRLAAEESAAIEKQRRWRERHRQELARQLRWAVRVKH